MIFVEPRVVRVLAVVDVQIAEDLVLVLVEQLELVHALRAHEEVLGALGLAPTVPSVYAGRFSAQWAHFSSSFRFSSRSFFCFSRIAVAVMVPPRRAPRPAHHDPRTPEAAAAKAAPTKVRRYSMLRR